MSGVHHDGGRHHVTQPWTAWTRVAFAAIVLLLSLAAPVAAGPLEEAQAAIDRKDHAAALRIFRLAADRGDAAAQNKLGDVYFGLIRLGVPQDWAEAAKWYRLAADQGNGYGQSSLGFMYLWGTGGLQSSAEALKWLRLAAAQGLADAQNGLGFMYIQGMGVPQDYAEAAKWLRLAADQGKVDAYSQLGELYRDGYGVPKDYVRAHMWFNLSGAQQGYEFARSHRDDIAKLMTPAQIAEAQKLAREWQSKRP